MLFLKENSLWETGWHSEPKNFILVLISTSVLKFEAFDFYHWYASYNVFLF